MTSKAQKLEGSEAWVPTTVPCTVRGVKRLTSKSVLVSFDPGPARPRFRYAPGQRVSFCLKLNDAMCFRSYNLINEVDALPQIAVKHVAQGGGSAFFNEKVQTGDVIQVVPPAGHLYDLDIDHKAHHILLFAAGSGITPLISVARHALKARPDHKVTLIYANSSPRDIMLQEALDEMAHSRRFEVFHVLGDGATGEDLSSGRLDRAKLHRLLVQYRIPSMPEAAFQSGPRGFMQLVDEVGQRQQVPLKTRRYSFMNQPLRHPEDTWLPELSSDVMVTLNGATRVIENVSRHRTLLEAADEAGLSMPANCRSGICHRCKAKLVSGFTVHNRQAAAGRRVPSGWILCCQNRPGSDRVEIDMG